MVVKKLKVKKKSGRVVMYSTKKIRSIVSKTGYTGKLLLNATNGVFTEAKKLTKGGVISVTNLEKAIVRSVNKTNDIAMNTVQKTTKKILK